MLLINPITPMTDTRSSPSPGSGGSSASSTKRLRASPPPKPTPKRTSKTPAPSSKATFNPSSPNAAKDGLKRHWAKKSIFSPVLRSRVNNIRRQKTIFVSCEATISSKARCVGTMLNGGLCRTLTITNATNFPPVMSCLQWMPVGQSRTETGTNLTR